MDKNKPTKSQIQVVMSDWLGNLREKDEGNYTHRGKKGIRVSGEDSFSEYLIPDADGMCLLELIKQSRIAAEDVVNAVVSEPSVVRVGSDGSCHSSEDGRHVITLATDYFADPTLSNRQKVDILLGLAAHEAAHGAYTEDSLTMKSIMAEMPQFRELKMHIWNLIEDERIEYLLGEEHPGLIDALSVTKSHYFKEATRHLRASGQMPKEPLPKLLATLMLAIRYPSQMDLSDVEECFDELNEIRKILTPFPMTPEGTWDATDKVMDVIRSMAEQKAREDAAQQSQSQGRQQQSQSQPSQGGGQQPHDGNKNGTEGNSSQPAPTAKQVADALGQMLSSSEATRVMKAIATDIKKGEVSNSIKPGSLPVDYGCAMKYVNEDDSEMMQSGAGGGNPDTFVFKPKGNQNNYLEALRHVRAYIPAMAKTLSCKGADRDYQMRGMPSGKLNTNKLASFRMGNVNIFDKRSTVTCSRASVVMLIDESGSMQGERQQAARDTAVLINEAIKRIPKVSFHCYGYTSSRLNVYSEGTRPSRWALGDTAASGGTPTGEAMRLAGERVRRLTADPCLMLVLTDGAADHEHKVIEQDKALRTKNIFPIGIGIQTAAVKATFSENVEMKDISELPLALGRLTRGKLDKMLVRHEEV